MAMRKAKRSPKTPVAKSESDSPREVDTPPPAEGPERLAPWWPTYVNTQAPVSRSQIKAKQRAKVPLTENNLWMLTSNSILRYQDAQYPFDSSRGTSVRHATQLSGSSSEYSLAVYQNGILDPSRSLPPRNLRSLVRRLKAKTEGSPPEEIVYKSYVRNIASAYNIETSMFEFFSLLKKYPSDEEYRTAILQEFTLPHDADFNKGLPLPCPSFTQGLEMAEFEPFRVEYISGAVVFKIDPDAITLPHIACEFKDGSESLEKGTVDCAHTGAALVFARNQALQHIGKPDPQGYAEVMTFATDGMTVNFFAHYAAESNDGRVKYHQYPIMSTNLKGSYLEFKKGWVQLQNCQDQAKLLSCDLRDQMLGHHKKYGARAWALFASGRPSEMLLSSSEGEEAKQGKRVVKIPKRSPGRGKAWLRKTDSSGESNDTGSSRSRKRASLSSDEGAVKKRRRNAT